MARKFCDVILQAYAHKSTTNDQVKKIWTEKGLVPPAIINIGYKGSGIPGSGDFAETVDSYRRSHGGQFVKPFVEAKAKYIMPSGYDVGRIAVVGFSAGGGAVKAILNGAEDAKKVDFAYFCDGLHSKWASVGCGLNASERMARAFSPSGCWKSVNIDTMNGVVEFAKQAALGLGPALVVTTSQIVPGDAYASTSEAVFALQNAVDAAVGGQPAQGGINPIELLGVDGRGPTPVKQDEQGGYWPGSWNPGGCPVPQVKIRNWDVVHRFAKGWFVCATFSTKGEGDKCDMGTNSQPAHIFQQQYVLPEVYRYILSERWKIECTSSSLEGIKYPSSTRMAQMQPFVPHAWGKAGSIIKHNPRLMREVATAGLGLGAEQGGASCFVEGVFSNVLTAEQISNQRLKLAAGVIGGAAGLAILYSALRK